MCVEDRITDVINKNCLHAVIQIIYEIRGRIVVNCKGRNVCCGSSREMGIGVRVEIMGEGVRSIEDWESWNLNSTQN